MNSDNLTDAINFELFKSGMDSFVSQYCESIDSLIKSAEVFFEDMGEAWASEWAENRCTSFKGIITRELSGSLDDCKRFCMNIQDAAKDWASAFQKDGLTGYNQITEEGGFEGKYSQDTNINLKWNFDADIYTWKEEDAQGRTGMHKKLAQAIYDKFESEFSKHLELLDGISSVNFGIRDSSGSINTVIKMYIDNIKKQYAARIKNMHRDLRMGLEHDIDNVEMGEELAAKYFEGN